MPTDLIDFVRKANKTRHPEGSIPFRVAVLLSVMTGVVTLVAQRAISNPTAVGVLVVLPLAYAVSYVRREKDNWHIKLLLTLGAIFALLRFLASLQGISTLDEVRFPLADIFLWVQVLHSFDLPARKDLNFSLGSSLALMAVAGSLSQDSSFGLFAVVYAVFAITAMVFSYRSEMEEGAAGRLEVDRPSWKAERPRVTTFRNEIARGIIATAVAGIILFLVIPQPSGAQSFYLPFQFGSPGGAAAGSGVANPGFSEGEAPGSRSSGTSYYGFSDRLDLRVRGRLSEELVMRVRSTAPALWKGIVFDSYDGVTWTADQEDPVPLGFEPPYNYPIEFRSIGPRVNVTQTFYVEAEQPSIVFAAGQPDVVWIPGGVNIDSNGSLRTDSTLTPGTVYSVVSSRGAANADELRRVPPGPIPEDIQRYLQLPDDLPARVHALAKRITADDTNNYDKIRSIEAYLRENYRYDLDSPVPPEGHDAVDYFLFESDVGFCEQFASATTIMLRSLGIPARVASGYVTGDRNTFTGYYEVKGSDAHTWVEAWYPGVGWYEYDPTYNVPPASTSMADAIPIVKVIRAIAGALKGILPAGGGDLLRSTLLLSAVATVLAGAWMVIRRTRRTRVVPVARDGPIAGGAVTRAFRRLEEALAARGRGRAPAETAAELLARTANLERSPTGAALSVFERERYGPEPPGPADAKEAVAELDRLAQTAVGLLVEREEGGLTSD